MDAIDVLHKLIESFGGHLLVYCSGAVMYVRINQVMIASIPFGFRVTYPITYPFRFGERSLLSKQFSTDAVDSLFQFVSELVALDALESM